MKQAAIWVFLGIGWFVLGAVAAPSALALPNVSILSTSYRPNAQTGESITFQVTLLNNTNALQFAEVDITLTNFQTGVESTLLPVLTVFLPARRRQTLTGTYAIAAGSYSVSFPLFDGNGTKMDQVFGEFGIQVGTETEQLRVFPEALHLGSIPPGRFMHPTPIEVSWDFFRFNRQRMDEPFTIRIYTDNGSRYHGIRGALERGSPAGLVSGDGKYAIPLKVWSLNFGPDIEETGWDALIAGPPPVDEDRFWKGPPLLKNGVDNLNSASWVRVSDLSEMNANPGSWRRLIGQDLTDSHFVGDGNASGDFTLKNPFTLYLATDGGPTAVEGSYSATLVVELWSP